MLFYRFLLTGLTPLIALALFIRVLRKQETLRDFCERLGVWRVLARGKVIWLHGASNGELTAAYPLIERLAADHPNDTLLITCNTVSAKHMVQTWTLKNVDVRLAPLDLRWLYRRIFKGLHLRSFILFEADFWPNRILIAQKLSISTALIGGRLSDKSARGWGRFSRLSETLFGAFDLICPQDDASMQRLMSLGAKTQSFGPKIALKSHVISDTVAAPHAARKDLWLAASTHAGEDETLLHAHKIARESAPNLRMILAPRHPKRAKDIIPLAQSLNLKIIQRSLGADISDPCDVYLADTLGDMEQWYRAAGVCFVAGSLVEKGGHTPFEPALHECALLHGPHLENFMEPYAQLQSVGGAQLCRSVEDIAKALGDLQNEARADEMRTNARDALAPTQDLNAVLNALDKM